ncbi:MAG: TatD family hydrolase [Candidatus Pseudobacter hemicellulosilyticus]|uniref:TatD family hydrolase n=1 Tax=Candidatus Pseudobacter hemicellulosilyticus TaxID=3121375 RepID=A0AAJ5WUH7_9BACT|nr:MAG: TatD family hydrolase [Pseudobacter sp.]
MQRQIIDTHCHLYLPEFSEEMEALLSRASAEGVEQIYLPAIDSETVPALLDLEARYPGKCLAMMGLHPCYVKANYREELQKVGDWLSKRPFAAIGEIGLDYFWDDTFLKEQAEAFHEQISLALQYSLPIVIHSRNATDECIRIVQERQQGSLRGIFHCFGGSLEQAQQIIDAGFYLGIGGVLTYKKSGLAEVLEQVSLEYLVLETDAPYLTPVPFRGKRNEPSYLKYIVERLAEVKNVAVEEVCRITSENAKKIFGRYPGK